MRGQIRKNLGSQVIRLGEVSSTNDVVRMHAERGAPEGLAVVAAAQTAGRGRQGRTWHSPAGSGLYVSVLLRPTKAALSLLTLAGGVALCEAVRENTGLRVMIKWPNDLLAPEGRRKLAGILVEGSSTGEGVDFAVFGFGLNIGAAAYPLEIRDRATSLEEELGRPVDADLVLGGCLEALDRRYRDLLEGRRADVLARWRELAPDVQGTRVEWMRDGTLRRGVTAGIDETGALLVRTDGAVERIVSGEVTWCFSR